MGRVVVVGAGPAGLAAAEALAAAGCEVAIFERMPNPARKFLLAGRGGLNLTHSEDQKDFLGRYGAARERLEPAIRAFSPMALVNWCEGLGVETFIGSSGRVFPKAMKASPLLRAWLKRLEGLGVKLHARARWMGWRGDELLFETPEGGIAISCDAAVFALGGASWPRLGSDGSWVEAFRERGAEIAPLRASNSGFLVSWSDIFREKFAGQPVKPARFLFGGEDVRGEAIVTDTGIEGGAIYALSAKLREAIAKDGFADLVIDLHPGMKPGEIARRLAAGGKASMANRLRKVGLSQVAAGLIRERVGGPALPSDVVEIQEIIRACVIRLTGVAPIERAISTAGGIAWDSIAPDYSLTADPRTFVAGEMLDWEAPTGGYLLQACFSTGRAAADGVLKRLGRTA